jgi:hypothetical protein
MIAFAGILAGRLPFVFVFVFVLGLVAAIIRQHDYDTHPRASEYKRVATNHLAARTTHHAIALLDPYLDRVCTGPRGLDCLKPVLKISSHRPLPQSL